MKTISSLRYTSVLDSFVFEDIRTYLVRAAGDYRLIVLHPAFEHALGEVAAGDHVLHAIVNVVPDSVARHSGLTRLVMNLSLTLSMVHGFILVFLYFFSMSFIKDVLLDFQYLQ